MRKVYLNYGWYFKEKFEEKDLVLNNYEGFIEVDLPHTNKEVPLNNFDQSISFFVSIYKKKINIESLEKDNILVFEGVGHKADIYVNGHLVFSHYCGYTEFKVNLNEFGKVGENEIAVVCDSREVDQPPFGFVIDYLCFGGIYRDVYLDVLDKTHIEDYYFHHDYENIFIDYKLSNDKNALIEATIKNDHQEIKLSCKNGDELKTKLPKVDLWDVDNPNLYDLDLKVIVNGVVVDEIKDRVGFRYIKFTEHGFYLNDKHLKIRGLNRHQSYPYVGYAMPKSMQEDDANLLKNKLCLNAVRTSHYPQSVDFLNRCDELGLLVLEEFPGWQHIGDLAWQEKAVNNLKEMIIRDKNHPSIFLWGVRINESDDNHDFYIKTNEVAHTLDPYRPTGGIRCKKFSELLEDVYTFNDFICSNKGVSLHRKEQITETKKPYLVTEYSGHMMPTKPFDREIRRTDVALLHASVLKEAANYDLVSGTFGWCFADYNTHLDFGSGDLICYHGVLDIFRNPKFSAYPYMTKSKEPFLEVTSNFNIGDHDGGYIRYFAVMTNCDKVEMYHDDFLVSTFDHLEGEFNGCFKVDDLIGNSLVELEKMTKEESDEAKAIIKELLDYDMIARDFIVEKYGFEKVNQCIGLFGKYVSNWGSHPTPYHFVGYKDGKKVIELTKGPQHLDHINVEVSNKVLHTKRSYDVTRITLEAIGNLGSRCDYAFDAFMVKTSDNLKVIGDELIYLNSGIRSVYVKSLNKSGKGKVEFISSRFKPITVDLDIVED